MKKLMLLALAAVTMLGLNACDKISGVGPVVIEEFNVSSFDRVQSEISGNVYISESSSQAVKVEAQQNIIDRLDISVENNILKIKMRKRANIINYGTFKVFVSAAQVKGITAKGSGNVEVSGGLTSREIDLKLTGSGNCKIDHMNSRYVYTELTGSGNMSINVGSCDQSIVRLTGSGDYNAKDFSCDEAEATVAGSGSATLRANSKLKATITGSGNIYYYGQPVVDANVTGSGNLKHRN